MAALIWHDGHGERSVTLDRDAVFAIGRGSSVQVAIEDPLVSRLHAELVFASARWRVVDLRSHNGTSVNGEPVRGSRTLIHGDVVRCGSTRIVFHEPERIHSAGSQPATADAPPLPVLGSGEREMLLLLDADPLITTPQIANTLHLSDDGVRQRLKRLYKKFDVGGPNSGKRSRLIDAVRALGLFDD